MNWFEIPAIDVAKAMRFYSKILQVKMLEIVDHQRIHLSLSHVPTGEPHALPY